MCQELSRCWGSSREIKQIEVPALLNHIFLWSKTERQTSYKMHKMSDYDKGDVENKIKWVRRLGSA